MGRKDAPDFKGNPTLTLILCPRFGHSDFGVCAYIK
jgi:hypothetical protein